MGTQADCLRGEHTADNQGLCWWCGLLVEPDWWAHYIGETNCDTQSNERQVSLFDSQKEVEEEIVRIKEALAAKNVGKRIRT